MHHQGYQQLFPSVQQPLQHGVNLSLTLCLVQLPLQWHWCDSFQPPGYVFDVTPSQTVLSCHPSNVDKGYFFLQLIELLILYSDLSGHLRLKDLTLVRHFASQRSDFLVRQTPTSRLNQALVYQQLLHCTQRLLDKGLTG